MCLAGHILAARFHRHHHTFNGHPGNRHVVTVQFGIKAHCRGADLYAVLEQGRAIRDLFRALNHQVIDFEAFLALQAVMLLRATKPGFAGGHGEIEAQLPKRIARFVIGKGIHLGVIEGVEQQKALGP
jgi:hypothetical protein